MTERPTFSPFWHRVRAMKPRLRPQVQITRQLYRARRWHIVRDPSSNQFYRLNPIAHEFVGLFDGTRTVEEIWKLVLARHGDAAPTQGEAIQLISQLYNSNLLAADASPETEQLLRRGRERAKAKVAQQAIGIMYFKLRLFNPDRMLAWLEPILRPILNRWGFAAWAIFLVWSLSMMLPHWDRLASGIDSAVAPANWGWLMLVFVVTKAIHEIGHGVICRRFGGQVPEFGVMLLVLFPAPYVDASSAWAFASKWRRMAVGAGGMIFELFIAAIASIVWRTSSDGSLAQQVAYNAMLTASVSTVIFNANPLMRFDGYFILADLIEVPNLMQRSMKMLQYLAKVHLFRMRNEAPPTASRSEGAILVAYGVLALVYRVFLFISITLSVMGRLFALGLALAVWTGAMWFILPVGKLVHWLATSPSIADRRGRVIATTLATFALALGAVGLVPVRDHRRASGVVESLEDPGVFFGSSGFVERAHARSGEWVAAGQPLLTLRNDELAARLDQVRAQIDQALALEQRATGRDEAAAAQVARERLRTLREQEARIVDRVDKLVVRAPRPGRLVGRDPGDLVGSWAQEGAQACQVVNPDSLRIVALLDQREAAWPLALGIGKYSAEARLYSRVQRALPAEIDRVEESGQRRLPHASFSSQGGGQVEASEDRSSGLMAKKPQFRMYLRLSPDADRPEWMGMPGERVALRFTLPRRPLLGQWLDRLHKLVQGKVNV